MKKYNKQRLFEVMNRLDPSFRGRVVEEIMPNPPRVLYHGSNTLFDINSLQVDRSGLDLQDKGSGSAGKLGNCIGIYLTPSLWDGPERDRRIYQPLYQKGVSSNESAEKYANWQFRKYNKAYIYQVELASDIKLDDSIGVGGIECIHPDTYKNSLQRGIDGYISNGNQTVIINKEKIASIKPIFYADNYCYLVAEYVRGKLDANNGIIVPYNYINYALKTKLGNVYHIESNENNQWIYFDGEKGDNATKTVLVKMHDYPLDWKNM